MLGCWLAEPITSNSAIKNLWFLWRRPAPEARKAAQGKRKESKSACGRKRQPIKLSLSSSNSTTKQKSLLFVSFDWKERRDCLIEENNLFLFYKSNLSDWRKEKDKFYLFISWRANAGWPALSAIKEILEFLYGGKEAAPAKSKTTTFFFHSWKKKFCLRLAGLLREGCSLHFINNHSTQTKKFVWLIELLEWNERERQPGLAALIPSFIKNEWEWLARLPWLHSINFINW